MTKKKKSKEGKSISVYSSREVESIMHKKAWLQEQKAGVIFHPHTDSREEGTGREEKT